MKLIISTPSNKYNYNLSFIFFVVNYFFGWNPRTFSFDLVFSTKYCGISFFSSGFKAGSITASTLLLNPVYGGNVLIGTTTDNGYKLQVNGSERVYGDLIVDGEVSALVS